MRKSIFFPGLNGPNSMDRKNLNSTKVPLELINTYTGA